MKEMSGKLISFVMMQTTFSRWILLKNMKVIGKNLFEKILKNISKINFVLVCLMISQDIQLKSFLSLVLSNKTRNHLSKYIKWQINLPKFLSDNSSQVTILWKWHENYSRQFFCNQDQFFNIKSLLNSMKLIFSLFS
jgi:hypothetical protein